MISARPTGDTLHAVTRLVGTCEPSDIIANRLDPWHGAWYHPYSFTRLEVLTTPTDEADRFLVAVTFRIGRVGVPTVAEFTSPEARTIVMRILDGEGTGSVVETHATPIGLGPDNRPRTAVIEAVVATLRPHRIQAGTPRRPADHRADARCRVPALERRPRLRRAPLPAARRYD